MLLRTEGGSLATILVSLAGQGSAVEKNLEQTMILWRGCQPLGGANDDEMPALAQPSVILACWHMCEHTGGR